MIFKTYGMSCFVMALLFATRPAVAFPVYGYGSANGSQLSALESSVTHQLNSVEKTLESTHKELSDARKQFAKADSAFRQQSHEHQLLVQQVHQEADSNPHLVAARKQLVEAESAFHRERERVLQRLKTDSSYTTLLDQKQAATSQLQLLATGDSQETRASLAKRIADLSASLNAREAAAIAADQAAKPAQASHLEAEQKLAALIRDRNTAIDKDARLRSDKIALDRVHNEHEAARRQLLQVQATATQAERTYQSLMQEKILLDQRHAQQQRASRFGYGYGRSSRFHFNPGPLGGALRIAPPPTVIIH